MKKYIVMTIGMFMFFGNAFASIIDDGKANYYPNPSAVVSVDNNGMAYFAVVEYEGPTDFRTPVDRNVYIAESAERYKESWALELLDAGTDVSVTYKDHTVLYWARERNLEKLLERLEKDGYIPELEAKEERLRRDNMRVEIPMNLNRLLLPKCKDICLKDKNSSAFPADVDTNRFSNYLENVYNDCLLDCNDRFAEGNQVEFNIIEGVRYGTDFVVNQLIENGTNLSVVDETGKNALYYATEMDDQPIMSKLREAGARE
jgi:hypothetical protein